jgi:dTDP-4-amino-4,6-dideoxygalactose transaminase
VIFDSEEKLLEVESKLKENNILPRRYFYPSLNTIKYTNGASMPVSESISARILCLPLFKGLDLKEVEQIARIINNTI